MHWSETAFVLLKSVCQIVILAVMLYYALKFLRRSRGYHILVGILVVIVALYLGTELFGFHELGWLFGKIAPAIPVFFVILFQPELRRMFANLGTRRRDRAGPVSEEGTGVVSALVSAASALAARRHGAIVAIEQEESLEPYSTGGRLLNAPVNAELLRTIFYPGSPMHDGGVIVRGGSIVWAGCVFPLGTGDERRAYGTRHRAAIGLSERTDALVVVVSEETGLVSIAHRGELMRGIGESALADVLRAAVGAHGVSGPDQVLPAPPPERGGDPVADALRAAKEGR